jgi:SAM-dependent methyltransferase
MPEARTEKHTERAAPSADRLKLLRKLRKHWDGQFEEKRGFDFSWYTDTAPEELADFISSLEARGAALDVGCGAGVLTAFLASQGFAPAVGFDIAQKGLLQARERSAVAPYGIDFTVAAAPDFPFREGCFTFVVDRGCVHLLDESMWADYFVEADRVLMGGGYLYLIEAARAWRSMEPLAARHFAVEGVTPSTIIRKGSPLPMANVALKKPA